MADDQKATAQGALAQNASGNDVLVRDVRYLTEQEEARERLKNSIDALTQQASLQVQMQKEPLKMLGGASAVGAVLGLVIGRQFKKTKRVYVDAGSPVKHQQALVKAQNRQKQSAGGALAATLGTLAFKTVMDRVVTPRLEEVANSLLEKSGQAPATATPSRSKSDPSKKAAAPVSRPAASPAFGAPLAPVTSGVPAAAPAPAMPTGSGPVVPSASGPISTGGVSSFVKPVHVGVIAPPESHVEAKAQGTPIDEEHKSNPNLR